MEETKKAIEELGHKINHKLDQVENDLKGQGKVGTDLKKEVDALTSEWKLKTEEFEKSLTEKQEQLDNIETTLNRKKLENEIQGVDMEAAMEKAFNDVKSEKGKVMGQFLFKASDEESMEPNAIRVKATMTQAVSLTGDVIESDRVRAGIQSPLERMNHVRPFFAPGRTNSNQVNFVEETALTDAIAGVAEGALLPQNDFSFTEQTSPVKKVGAHLKTSREMLEDIPQLMSYLQSRLRQRYMLFEDNQLLFGTGVGENLEGVAVNATAFGDPGVFTSANNWDVLRFAVTIAAQAEYMPNAIMLNPVDVRDMDLEKDSQGRYILPNIFSGAGHQVSGIPIIQSTAVTADNFIVGDFNSAQIFDRRELLIEIATEDQDDFIRDLITVRMTTRLALVKYRPAVFITDTFTAAKAALAS